MVGCQVAADRSALARVTSGRRGQWHHQNSPGDFGDHEPVGRWFGGVEQWLTCPDVFDVVDAQMYVFEQVADLMIDLERPLIVKEIGIEPFHSHAIIVLQMTTDDYGLCLQIDR